MALIRTHIGTAEPVGSKSLVDRSGLGVSPATVRNLMAQLEQEGYLRQPHTSAGRVPTDKAYRYYVNSLLGREPDLREEYDDSFRRALTGFSGGLDDLLRKTSRILSDLSRCAGVVLPPRRVRGRCRNRSVRSSRRRLSRLRPPNRRPRHRTVINNRAIR